MQAPNYSYLFQVWMGTSALRSLMAGAYVVLDSGGGGIGVSGSLLFIVAIAFVSMLALALPTTAALWGAWSAISPKRYSTLQAKTFFALLETGLVLGTLLILDGFSGALFSGNNLLLPVLYLLPHYFSLAVFRLELPATSQLAPFAGRKEV